jgi:hypothetical protein
MTSTRSEGTYLKSQAEKVMKRARRKPVQAILIRQEVGQIDANPQEVRGDQFRRTNN